MIHDTSGVPVPQRHPAVRVDFSYSWGRFKSTIETLLTALILAFMFRAFMVEAFIIPTGSMAPGLRGDHGVAVCKNCGWEFDFAPGRGRTGEYDVFPWPPYIRCPNCQMRYDNPQEWCPPGKPGDRLLVHKWPFVLGGLLGPRRWDVIVFRDPKNPSENYIKRVAALPSERIEIIDGDVFIGDANGGDMRIARKTTAAQRALWSVVYDHDFPPRSEAQFDVRARWVSDSQAKRGYGWSGMKTRVIRHRGEDVPSRLRFAPRGKHLYFQDVYGYNHGSSGMLVGDVRIVTEFTPLSEVGWCEFVITRGHRRFACRVGSDGSVSLYTVAADQPEVKEQLASRRGARLRVGRPVTVEFGHLDLRAYVRIDGRTIAATTDEQYAPYFEQYRMHRGAAPVAVEIVAAEMDLELRGLRIDRDVYYTQRAGTMRRASTGAPFELESNEYFVLGDNSPNSYDSRAWTSSGPHLPRDYRAGTVRRDQIVGRAFFVYLTGLMPLDAGGWLQIPDLGRVRFVR